MLKDHFSSQETSDESLHFDDRIDGLLIDFNAVLILLAIGLVLVIVLL